MDATFTIVHMTIEYQRQIEGWATPNAAMTLLKLPEVSMNPESQAWVGLIDNLPIAVCSISQNDDGVSSLYFIVKPSERRSGIGAHIVTYVLNEVSVKNLSH